MAIHSLQVARAKKILGSRVPKAQGAVQVYVESLVQMSEAMESALSSASPAFLTVIGGAGRGELVTSLTEVEKQARALRVRIERFSRFPEANF